MKCDVCDDVLYSRYQGHFDECECKASFVDQTMYYSRIGGAAVQIQENKNTNQSL